jgi:hypothetical protein
MVSITGSKMIRAARYRRRVTIHQGSMNEDGETRIENVSGDYLGQGIIGQI